jgi:hypothetical protein
VETETRKDEGIYRKKMAKNKKVVNTERRRNWKLRIDSCMR